MQVIFSFIFWFYLLFFFSIDLLGLFLSVAKNAFINCKMDGYKLN